MVKQSVESYAIVNTDYINFREDHSKIIGMFFSYDEAREFLTELVNTLTDRRKNGEAFLDYTLSTYWDAESNCDRGASIIYTPIEDGAKEICSDYAIEPVPLYADWKKISVRPISLTNKLDISESEPF